MTGVVIFIVGVAIGGFAGYNYEKIVAKIEKLFE